MLPHIYTGPLSVSYAGVTLEEANHLIGFARILLGKVAASADAGGVDTGSMWHTTDEGITVKVMKAADIYVAYIFRPEVKKEEAEGEAPLEGGLPSPYGGVVVPGLLVTENKPTIAGGTTPVYVLDSFAPNAATAQRFGEMREALNVQIDSLTAELSTGLLPAADAESTAQKIIDKRFTRDHLFDDQQLHKVDVLAFPVPGRWSGFYDNPAPTPPSGVPDVFSIHHLLKPTMYTGRMRAIVQYLMGFGTQRCRDIVDPYAPDGPKFERAPTDGDGPEDIGFLGAIRYWCHFDKSHGVYKTSGGRYYLIEISQARGVLAMRLPVFPRSHTALPVEMHDVLHDIPCGYTFPDNTTDALAAGWVKELLPPSALAEFYKLQGTYAQCGWAFSYTGSHADNVGYHYPNPRPFDFPEFQHWSISINGGDGESSDTYDYRHDGLLGYDRSLNTLAANILHVSSGHALDTSLHYKPFKIPSVDRDTGIPCVKSFDMTPTHWPLVGQLPQDYLDAQSKYPLCDTTVHVFYDGDELVWLRYYFDPKASAPTTEAWDDRDEGPNGPVQCMILGSYTWGSTTNPGGLPKSFYSNRVDNRAANAGSNSSYRSTGRKVWESPFLGIAYTRNKPPFHFGYEDSFNAEWFNDFNPAYNSLFGSPWAAKRHAYWIEVRGTNDIGQQNLYAAAIPLTDRECFFLYHRDAVAQHSTIDYRYAAMVMQWVYYVWDSRKPDPDTGITQPLPGGGWEWWQTRDDTVKYTAYQWYPVETNLTREARLPAGSVVNVATGVHTAPVSNYDRSQSTNNVNRFTVSVVQSRVGGEYGDMVAQVQDTALWEGAIPSADGGIKAAYLWCTKSLLGVNSYKMHYRIDGVQRYVGLNFGSLSQSQREEPRQQVTFVGVV